MRKRKPSLSDDDLGDVWGARREALGVGSLPNLDKMVAAGVGRCLNEDKRSRSDIATALSEMLDEDISVHMLNAYSSESRREHPISVHRFFALTAISGRYDILDSLLRQVGAKALDQADVKMLRLGKAYANKLDADRRLDAAAIEFGI